MTASPGCRRDLPIVRILLLSALAAALIACSLLTRTGGIPDGSPDGIPCPDEPGIKEANYYLCVRHSETIDNPAMSYRLHVDPEGESCIPLTVVKAGPGSPVQQWSDGRIQFIVEGWLGGPDGKCDFIAHPVLVETIRGTCKETGNRGYLQLSITEEWEDVAMTLQCPGGPAIPFGEVIRTGHRVPEERPFYLKDVGSVEVREEASAGGATVVSVWELLIETVPVVPIPTVPPTQ